MPARTGRQYLNGLREQDREVWLAGERVRDVTTHPGLANGARAIASLYDMQMEHPLWAEQRPENWADASVKAIRGVLGFLSGCARQQQRKFFAANSRRRIVIA